MAGLSLGMSADAAARSKRSSWSPSVSQEAKENQAGVGILFVEEEDPSGFVRVTVKALIEGGSAEKTGMVKSGDMVVRVGNQDVIGKPLSILRTMIPGPIGSYCRLGFLRGGVALNSNAVQEKSTYYDVQLLRQPAKNEKRKLVTAGSGSPEEGSGGSTDGSSSGSLYSSQNTLPSSSAANSVDSFPRYAADGVAVNSNLDIRRTDLRGETISETHSHSPVSQAASDGSPGGVRVSPKTAGAQTMSWSPGQKPESNSAGPYNPPARPGSFGSPAPQHAPLSSGATSSWQPGNTTTPTRATASAPSPGLSQSYDSRSLIHQQQQQQIPSPSHELPKRPDVSALSSKLSNSVDMAISNVDRALYEMQSREIERLRAKLEASEKRGGGGEDDMSRHSGSPSASAMPGHQHSSTSPEKRRVELLEKQIYQLKQEKQAEEMKRLEAESALKVMERRVSEMLQQQQKGMMQVGHESMRIQELQQQIAISEEKRREEEKKRAIMEGKVRHLENQAKQNSPFRFQNMKGRKPPPAHLPDITEGKEMLVPMMNPNFMAQHGSPNRSPTLSAIDGPVPDGMHYQGYDPQMMQGMVPVPPGMQPDLYGSTPGMQNGLYSSASKMNPQGGPVPPRMPPGMPPGPPGMGMQQPGMKGPQGMPPQGYGQQGQMGPGGYPQQQQQSMQPKPGHPQQGMQQQGQQQQGMMGGMGQQQRPGMVPGPQGQQQQQQQYGMYGMQQGQQPGMQQGQQPGMAPAQQNQQQRPTMPNQGMSPAPGMPQQGMQGYPPGYGGQQQQQQQVGAQQYGRR